MRKPLKKVLPFVLLLQIAAAGAPAFGVSLEDEIKLGKEEHVKILARFGGYRDQELQAYLSKVGQ